MFGCIEQNIPKTFWMVRVGWVASRCEEKRDLVSTGGGHAVAYREFNLQHWWAHRVLRFLATNAGCLAFDFYPPNTAVSSTQTHPR